MQHILVTGGAGVLGRLIVKQLSTVGYSVRGMSRRARPGDDWPGAEWAQADLETGEGIEAALEGAEIIVHCAGSGPPMPLFPGMPVTRTASQGVFYHHHRVGIPFPVFPNSFHPDQRLQYWQDQDRERSAQSPQVEAVRIEVDESAYLEGWRDAVKGIWQTISPAFS